MSALVEPNPQPQAALMHDGGPLLVFGGAGKVPTLAARVAGPARWHGADAQDLIAIARLSLGCTKTHARVPHFVLQRFCVTRQRAFGDRHLHASRSRFMAAALAQRLAPVSVVPSPPESGSEDGAHLLDLGAALRAAGR